MPPMIIGIAGSSGSGKTSLSKAIADGFEAPSVCLISLDSFYRPLSPTQSAAAYKNQHNFDDPQAIDFESLYRALQMLKSGQHAEIPVYSFERHSRELWTERIEPPRVLILEGIFALHDHRVLDLLTLKIFCEADADICLSRRLVRDVTERGRDIEGCIEQWFGSVKPSYYRYGRPQRDHADIIVPRGAHNAVAINMISMAIDKVLNAI